VKLVISHSCLFAVAFVIGGLVFTKFAGTIPSSLRLGGDTTDPLESQDFEADIANDTVGRRVGALGRLEPQSEILDIAAPVGDRLSRLLVSEGQFVEKAQELAYLESHDERLAEKEYIAAQLDEAERQLQAESQLGNARIRSAEVRLNQVEQLGPLRIGAQEAKVRMIEAELEHAQDELDRAKRLGATISEEELEQRRLLHTRTVENLSSERAVLAELKAALGLDVQSAKAELEEAQASLEKALAAIQIASLKKSLSLAEARLSRTIIRAPIAGQILNILTWPGERTHAAEPILQMGDTDQMHAVAEVYETDVRLVRLGQSAVITSPALPEPLTGQVVQIGVSIYKNDVLDVDPAADADARVIEVRIRLDQSAVAAKFTNLQVDIEISVDTDPDR